MVLLLGVTNVTFVRTFLITDSKFKCTVTGKTYLIKDNLPCDSCNVIYLITCSNFKEQHIKSAILFKKRFRIHKSDIKTDIKINRTNDCCGTTRYFVNKCCSPNNKHAYLEVHITE